MREGEGAGRSVKAGVGDDEKELEVKNMDEDDEVMLDDEEDSR